MRSFAWIIVLTAACFVGCDNGPVESESTVSNESHEEHGEHEGHGHEEHGHQESEADSDEASHGHEDGHAAKPAVERFVADKMIKVPEMMCPYSCWPSVKESLEKQPGIAGVQLAEQPEGTPEGEIAKRVIELKIEGEFDPNATLAAVKEAGFDAEVVN